MPGGVPLRDKKRIVPGVDALRLAHHILLHIQAAVESRAAHSTEH